MLRILIFSLFFFCSLTAYGAAQSHPTVTLSLKEAILLAIRENPSVQQAQLNLIQQKFALEVAHWQFQPHFTITGAASLTSTVLNDNRRTSHSFSPQPTATWTTPIGTQLTLTSMNNISNHYNPQLSLQIVQPLIRGFGRAIVEAALYNAIDSERVSRLNVENALRLTVTAVINAYLNVVSAENTVKIDEDALKRAEISVERTKLFIKAGRKAGVELVTVEADVANARTKLENDKNTSDQMRYALLTAIGIDPNTRVKFTNIDVPHLIKKYSAPTLEETKHLTLENDIQYQVDQITLNGSTKRNLLVAEDNTRWQLNLTANGIAGGGAGGGQNAGFSSLANGSNQSQSLQLNLTIPIDDKNAQLSVKNARLALRQARVALQQSKWAKETNAINGWNSLYSAERALHFAEDAENLQVKTYKISFQKYSYGLIDSVELQSVQQQLIARQQSLLDARIGYLKALVNLDQQIGRTLQTWGIQVRDGS
ncbi:MAG: TolC family protein [Gammaproteobacteria bacterium]